MNTTTLFIWIFFSHPISSYPAAWKSSHAPFSWLPRDAVALVTDNRWLIFSRSDLFMQEHCTAYNHFTQGGGGRGGGRWRWERRPQRLHFQNIVSFFDLSNFEMNYKILRAHRQAVRSCVEAIESAFKRIKFSISTHKLGDHYKGHFFLQVVWYHLFFFQLDSNHETELAVEIAVNKCVSFL